MEQSKDNIFFMDILQDFLQYLQVEKKYSKHTVAAYKLDIEQYESYLQRQGCSTLQADAQRLRMWISALMLQNVSSRSVHRKLSSLHSYYHFLQQKGLVKENWVDKVELPKMSQRLPVFFSEDEMDNLFERITYEPTFEGMRDRVVLELLYSTGMRCSELIGLTHNDLDFSNHTIHVCGKRNKERLVPMAPLVAQILNEYMDVKSRTFSSASNAGVLLVTSKGAPMYREMVYRIVRKYIDMVSVLTKRSPHVIRHTFATHLLNHGADINAIKSILGHSSLASTQVYTHTSISQLKKTYNQAHPRA